MSRLRNDRVWKAGAFNHLRSPLRQISGPETANWKGIVARAKAILIDDNRLIIIVEPAGSIDKAPTKHDILNAQITTIVFGKQRRFRSYKRVVTYLEYDGHVRQEIPVDGKRIEEQFKSCLASQTGGSKLRMSIPSPLASFLILQIRKS